MKIVTRISRIACQLIMMLPMFVWAGSDPEVTQDTPEESVTDAKSYKIVDGNIDANTIEGWKIFRGAGACTACHGPSGEGGAGKNLMESVTERLDEKQFKWAVAEGKSGTLMKAFKYNQKVMDNLDNIYAYIQARADGVLGPDNLIKYPFGKKPAD